jgi:hypothetical protein
MKNAVNIITLIVLLLGSAAVMIIGGNAASGTQASGETVIYKDPDGKWPDGSSGPASRLERTQSIPYGGHIKSDEPDERWI